MKPSRYNTILDLPRSGVRLAFNARTLALVELRGEDVAIAEAILTDGGVEAGAESAAVRETLVGGGFLIDDDRDELAELEHRNRSARFGNRDHLGLTIAPTLTCNFRCVYCYETHPRQRMSPSKMDELLRWVEGETAPGKDLSVTWFGGEPLLALKEIRYLSRGFLANAERLGRSYSASIVTNGYLLSRDVAQELRDLRVSEAQVTLDGPRQCHDLRRPLANRSGTFDIILENLRSCHDLLHVSLRINVDKQNADSVGVLLDELEQAGLKGRVYPYFGHVFPYTDVCADIEGNCLRREEFSLLEARLRLELLRRGFAGVAYPRLKGGFCAADTVHCQVIGPNGDLGKCWNDICDAGACIGRIGSDERTPRMEANLQRWMLWDPFTKAECRECNILPICMGGCPYLAFRKGLTRSGECVDWKYNLKEMITLTYLEQRWAEEHSIASALRERVERIRAEVAGGDRRPRELDPRAGPSPACAPESVSDI